MSSIQTRNLVAKAGVIAALSALHAFGSLAADAEQSTQIVVPLEPHTIQAQATLNNRSNTSRKPGAFDSEGKPLPLPQDDAPIMEFSAKDYLQPGSKAKTANSVSPHTQEAISRSQLRQGSLRQAPSPRDPSPRDKDSWQTQDNRPYVANHPNCRWLDSRMDHLEQQLNSIGRGAHHSDELGERQREWRCLRCGAEGPEVYELNACRQPEARASYQR